MKIVKIHCDNCKTDLTYTSNSVDYRISVCNENIPASPELVALTDMMIYPLLKRDLHFCAVACLLNHLGE